MTTVHPDKRITGPERRAGSLVAFGLAEKKAECLFFLDLTPLD
jgi:hypothetical protein